MPTQDSYSPLTEADANTFATGFRKDPVTGALTTHKIPVPFLYGGKWTVNVGTPSQPGTGPGDQYLNVSNGDIYTWDNDLQSWGQPTGTLINGSYQFPIWCAGGPLSSEKLYSFEAPTPFFFTAGMTDTVAGADTAAAATTVFSLQRNGVEFGTITFAAGQSTGFTACPATVTFIQGDVFEVIAPAVQDVSLSNIRMTIVGIRPSGAAISDIISSGEAANSAAEAAASATTATGAASNAGASAGAASGFADAASASASSASGSAATATQKAADAAGSATAAGTSAGQAATSAAAADASAQSASDDAAAAAASAAAAATAQANVEDALTYYSAPNIVINGRGYLAARGASVTVATNQTSYGGPDRFRVALGATGGSCTQAQGSMIGPDGVTRGSIKQTVTSAATIFTGTAFWQGIHQLIEGIRAYRCLGQTVTVSGLFRASIAGQYTICLRVTDNTCYVQTLNVAANTVTPYSFQVAVPVNASIPNAAGTWGMILNIGAYGTGIQTSTLGAWNAAGANGPLMCATGSVAWPATASAFIEASDIKIEVSDRQTPYVEPWWEDLQRQCSRFYQVLSFIKFWGYSAAGGTVGQTIPFPVAMAKNPTLKTAGTWTHSNSSGPVFESINAWGCDVYVSTTATGPMWATTSNPAFDAEL